LFLRLKAVAALTDSDVTNVDVIDQHRLTDQQQRDAGQQGDEIHGGQKEQEQHLLPAEDNDVIVMECVGQKDGNSLRSASGVLCHIRDLLETRLRIDAQLRYETDKDQQIMNEWMVAAAVIDRICFIVFSLIFIIGTVVLFFLAAVVEH